MAQLLRAPVALPKDLGPFNSSCLTTISSRRPNALFWPPPGLNTCGVHSPGQSIHTHTVKISNSTKGTSAPFDSCPPRSDIWLGPAHSEPYTLKMIVNHHEGLGKLWSSTLEAN